MATANLTLTRKQSALVSAGRQQIVATTGDLWNITMDYMTDSERFVMGAAYNAIEAQIDDTIDSGFTVSETYGDGTLHGISKAPSRPVPPTH
jgi:hypothetical protein